MFPWDPNTNKHATSRVNHIDNRRRAAQRARLSTDSLKHCLCYYCNCLANVSPVRVVKDQIACGRCLSVGDGVPLPIVEALIKIYNFPCRYHSQGCNDILPHGRVESHEKSCNFKMVTCTIQECQWVGTKNSIQKHFEMCHTQQIINNTISIPLKLNENNTHNLLYVRKSVHLVNITCDGKTIKHSIKSFCTDLEALQICYDIKFSTKSRYVGFNQQKILSYDSNNETNNEGVSVELLQSVFQDADSIDVNIFMKSSYVERSELINVKDLECPVCYEVMLGSIFVRVCGHNMCAKCSEALENNPCPVCRMGAVDPFKPNVCADKNNFKARNYALEKLIQKVHNTI